MNLSDYLGTVNEQFSWLFDRSFDPSYGMKINLGKDNLDLNILDIHTMEGLKNYIDSTLQRSGKRFAYGGYGEYREFYKRSPIFLQGEQRTVHLGIDFWLPSETTVYLPLEGSIHSFADNAGRGNYGPTIITKHHLNNQSFFLLFGHVKKSSLDHLKEGDPITQGSSIGQVGDYHENGNWPPHLHFQVIQDLRGNHGDYPGVASSTDSLNELKNCPDPSILLNL